LLAAETVKRSLVVWDVGSGQKLQELNEDSDNRDRLLAFALSPDGRTLATNVESKQEDMLLDTLTLRGATGGRVIQTIKISERKETGASLKESLAMMKSGVFTEQSPVRAIRFSPDRDPKDGMA